MGNNVKQRVLKAMWRPERLAAMVGDSMEMLLCAIETFSATWGGGRNMLLPWPLDMEEQLSPGFWRTLLWHHDPDYVAVDGELTAGDRNAIRRVTAATTLGLDGVLWGSECRFRSYQDHIPVVLQEFVAGRTGEDITVLGCPQGDYSVEPSLAATIGYIFAEDQERLSEAGIQVVLLRDWQSNFPAVVDALLRFGGMRTARDLTLTALRPVRIHGTGMRSRLGLVLCEGNRLADVCYGWTMGGIPRQRLQYNSFAVVPVEVMRDDQNVEALYAAVLRDREANPDETVQPDIAVHTTTLSDAHVEEGLGASMLRVSRGSYQFRFGTHAERHEPQEGPPTYTVNLMGLPQAFDEAVFHPDQVPAIFVNAKAIFAVSLPEEISSQEQVSLRLDLSAPGLLLPRASELKGIMEGARCSTTKSGLSVGLHVHPRRDTIVNLRWPDPFPVLQALFYDRGLRIMRSDKADPVTGAIELFGGLARCDSLRQEAAIELLSAMAPWPDIAVVQNAIENSGCCQPQEASNAANELLARVIENDSPQRHFGLSDLKQKTSLPKKQLLAALDLLAGTQALHRGHELPCDRCGSVRWYPAVDIETGYDCLACGATNTGRVTSTNPQQEAAWSYRLAPQLAMAVRQGVLPVLLLASHLYTEHAEDLVFVPGAQMVCLPEEETVSDINTGTIQFKETRHHHIPENLSAVIGEGREIDLIASASGRTVIAEAKTKSAELDERDVDLCMTLSEQFYDVLVIFAFLDACPESTMNMIAAKAEERDLPGECWVVLDDDDLILSETGSAEQAP